MAGSLVSSCIGDMAAPLKYVMSALRSLVGPVMVTQVEEIAWQ
jgi:hypothetical protein